MRSRDVSGSDCDERSPFGLDSWASNLVFHMTNENFRFNALIL